MEDPGATAGQKACLRRLVSDLVLLFAEGRPEGTERDFCVWFGGIAAKYTGKVSDLAEQAQVEPFLQGLTKGEAGQLIGPLRNLRDRMKDKLSQAG